MELKTIAHIYTDFDEKFGIPRQSGLVPSLKGRIVFENEYRDPQCVKYLEDYDYIWLIWHFSEVPQDRKYSPVVRPPRLGGNKKVGVFASRSPFRPNAIGLSSVKLEKITFDEGCGPVLYVSGIDMLNATPIFDIKPYHVMADSHPGARSGFADNYFGYELGVEISDDLKSQLPQSLLEPLTGVLSQDPRPGYQKEEGREYGISFAGYNIKFTVRGKTLTVREIRPGKPAEKQEQ